MIRKLLASAFAFTIAAISAEAKASMVTGYGLGATSGASPPLSLFVSPTGAGVACTAITPCSVATAKAILSGRGSGTVNMQDGTYRIAATLSFTASDNGETWQAVAGAFPTFVGSVQATGWTTCASGCPAGVNAAVNKATVPGGTATRQLYVNGNREVRANGPTPNSKLSAYTADSTGFSGTNTISTAPDVIGAEVRGEGSFREFHCPITSATSSHLTLANACWQSSSATNAAILSTVNFTNAGVWTLENSLSLLTASGMWYLDGAGLDGAANTIYYWPRPNDGALSGADVEVPVVTTLLSLSGVSNLKFSGISFEYSTWLPQAGDGYMNYQGGYVYQTQADLSDCVSYNQVTLGGTSMCATEVPAAIDVAGSSNVTFTGNTFAHLGGAAIWFRAGTHNSTITASTFFDNSFGHVVIGDVAHTSDQSTTNGKFVHDNTVSNNAMFNNGQDSWGTVAIQVGYTTGTSVTSNSVMFSPYSGLMAGGFNYPSRGGASIPSYGANTYSNNLIEDAMNRIIQDGGSLYLTGSKGSSQGDTLVGNVVGSQGRGPNWYLDTATGYSTWTNDVQGALNVNTCFLFLQTGAGTTEALNNTFTTPFSTTSSLCGFSGSSGNTIGSPTIITGIYDSAASTIYAAAGGPNKELLHLGSGFPAVFISGDSQGAIGNCGGSPCNYTSDLGSAKTIHDVEAHYQAGTDTPGQRISWAITVSNDPTFSTGVTTIGSVDSSGSFSSYYYGSLETFVLQTPVSARYVRIHGIAASTWSQVTVH